MLSRIYACNTIKNYLLMDAIMDFDDQRLFEKLEAFFTKVISSTTLVEAK